MDFEADIVAHELVLVMDKYTAADVLREVSVYDTINPAARYTSKVRHQMAAPSGRASVHPPDSWARMGGFNAPLLRPSPAPQLPLTDAHQYCDPPRCRHVGACSRSAWDRRRNNLSACQLVALTSFGRTMTSGVLLKTALAQLQERRTV